MHKRSILSLLVLVLMMFLISHTPIISFAQSDGEGGDPDYCEEFPERCETEPDDGGSPNWAGYSDGRISPDPAEYYTIYCHSETIFVVRVVPETETIKEIPLIDAINLAVGQELALGDFMVMQRSSESIITIYGSNGNLAPEPGSKAFDLNDCIAANGGAPEPSDVSELPLDEGDESLSEEDLQEDARREAEDALAYCYSSYTFFGNDSSLLVDCLDFALATHQDALTGAEIFNLIIMIFCLNLIVGNGVLPIGIVVFLRWHRRWLRKQKTLS